MNLRSRSIPSTPAMADVLLHPSSPATQCSGDLGDLKKLAPEILIQIYESLPELWSIISLRLTCRYLDQLYLAHQKDINKSLRNHLVSPFYAYYSFLTNLHIPETALKLPPPGGWPSITIENCKNFGKTDLVIDVLRHLPYLKEIDGEWFDEWEFAIWKYLDYRNLNNIDYKCNVLDYSMMLPEDFDRGNMMYNSEFVFSIDSYQREGEDRFSGHRGDFKDSVPKHAVVVTEGYESDRIHLMLDLMTGEIWESVGKKGPGDYLPVEKFFEKKMQIYKNLQVVFIPGLDPLEGRLAWEKDYDPEQMERDGEPRGQSKDFGRTDADIAWIRHLYRKFGWPDPNWKKEEGLQAVKDYAKLRGEEDETRERERERRRSQRSTGLY